MALTNFPIIVFNASTGSDTLASGAGPATAVTGNCAAITNSLNITFSGSPDLSGVTADGSHVLYVSGLGFNRINTVDNAGKACVVQNAMTIAAGTTFAIGGKRATLDNIDSRKLYGTMISPTGPFGGASFWTMQAEDDTCLTISGSIGLSASTLSGSMMLKSSDTTIREFRQTGNATHFDMNTNNTIFEFTNIKFTNSNATKNVAFNQSTAGIVYVLFTNCIFGSADGVNCPNGAVKRTAGIPTVIMNGCSILRTGTTPAHHGLDATTTTLNDCEISRCSGSGITGAIPNWIYNTVFSYNGGNGIHTSNANGTNGKYVNCVFDSNTLDGLRLNYVCLNDTIVINSIFSNNGQAGVNLLGGGNTPFIEFNAFYANGTTHANNYTLNATNLTGVDPQFVNGASGTRNYALNGTNLRAKGFPDATRFIAADQTNTKSYVDIGVAQTQETAGAGSSFLTQPGMNGGING